MIHIFISRYDITRTVSSGWTYFCEAMSLHGTSMKVQRTYAANSTFRKSDILLTVYHYVSQ
jgi:hypothetical protein